MNKHILSLVLALGLAATGTAQNLMTVKYPIGFATGDLKDYIEKTSWRGFAMGYRYFADGNVAAGVDVAFHTFYERKDYATYEYGTASLSGVQYRYQWMLPMTAQVEWVLNEGEDFRPFLGIGAGALYAERMTDFGLYRFTQDPWQFLMKPEVGFTYYLSNGTAFLVAAEYQTGFETQELPGQSFISLNVGLVFATD